MPMPQKVIPLKFCQTCNAVLIRKRYGPSLVLEDMTAFKKRKYCGFMCMAKAMEKSQKTENGWRSHAKKFRGAKCQSCQTTKNLHIHHKDGSFRNNDLKNLETLCAHCHLTQHWKEWRKSRKCKICGERSHISGLCQKHYLRLKKHGNPLMTKRRIGSRWQLVQDAS